MGLFSWLWDFIGGFFSTEESVNQIETISHDESHIPKEQIPKYVKEFHRLETKRLKSLANKSELLFKKLSKDPRIEKHKQALTTYLEELGGGYCKKKTSMCSFQISRHFMYRRGRLFDLGY